MNGLQKIGRYEIESEIGSGGMAVVYQAVDPQFGRHVAVKLLSRDFLQDPSFRRRFEREARTIATLEHPAIVPVYDFGEEDGRPFLVMRLMPGRTLAQRLTKEGPLPVQDVAYIIGRIGAALDEAHRRGIVHRDLKPSNVLFDQYGEPYLSDFGIARQAGVGETITATRQAVGTPGYMSPEQIQGNEVDGRSDIYALGVMVFEMLTGKRPFTAPSPAMIMVKQMTEPVPHLRDLRPDVPSIYDQVVAQAMARRREERPESATAVATQLAEAAQAVSAAANRLAEAIEEMNGRQQKEETAVAAPAPAAKPPPVEETIIEPPATGHQPPTTPARRRLWPWVVGGVLLVAVIGSLFWQSVSQPAISSEQALVGETAVSQPTNSSTQPTNAPPAATTLDDGFAALHNHDFATAVAIAEQFLLKDRGDATAYYLRGLARREMGELDGAISDLNTALQIEPDPGPDLYLARAETFLQLDDPASAQADIAACLAVDGGFQPCLDLQNPVAQPAANVVFTDDFAGALDQEWAWQNENSDFWNLDANPGSLQILTSGSSLYGDKLPDNLLYRAAPDGDFAIVTEVEFDPVQNFQQAAILISADEDNFILLNRGFCDAPTCPGNGIFLDKEQDGTVYPDNLIVPFSGSRTYLKLRKRGNIYAGFYSEDGQNWILVGQLEQTMMPQHVGLTANNGNDNPATPPIPANFASFTLSLDDKQMLYDDFSENGRFPDPTKWEPQDAAAKQLTFLHDGTVDLHGQGNGYSTGLNATEYQQFLITEPMFFETDIYVDPVYGNGTALLHLHALRGDDGVNQEPTWYVDCGIWDWGNQELIAQKKSTLMCPAGTWNAETGHSYHSEGIVVDWGTWHHLRIEVEPETMVFRYFLDGQFMGLNRPDDAAALRQDRFVLTLVAWKGSSDTFSTRFDNVYIGRLAQ